MNRERVRRERRDAVQKGRLIQVNDGNGFEFIDTRTDGRVKKYEINNGRRITGKESEFAVKVFCIAQLSEEQTAYTVRGLTVLSRLSHDHVVAYIDSWEENDNIYVMTEYCEDGNLVTYMQHHHKSVSDETHTFATWLRDLGSALQYMHEKKIIHRNIKPGNIMVARQSSRIILKLADFGIAKVLPRGASVTNTVLGTAGFTSPEIENKQEYDGQTDVWSLGCCFYYLVTDQLAHISDSDKTVIGSLVSRDERHYKMRQRQDFLVKSECCSKNLCQIIQDMLNPDPSIRLHPPRLVQLLTNLIEKHGRLQPHTRGLANFKTFDKRLVVPPEIERADCLNDFYEHTVLSKHHSNDHTDKPGEFQPKKCVDLHVNKTLQLEISGNMDECEEQHSVQRLANEVTDSDEKNHRIRNEAGVSDVSDKSDACEEVVPTLASKCPHCYRDIVLSAQSDVRGDNTRHRKSSDHYVVSGNSTRHRTSSDHGDVSGNSTRHRTSTDHGDVSGNSTRHRTSTDHSDVSGNSTRHRTSSDHSNVSGNSTRHRTSSDHGDVSGNSTRHRTSTDHSDVSGNSSRHRTSSDHGDVSGNDTRHRTSSDHSDVSGNNKRHTTSSDHSDVSGNSTRHRTSSYHSDVSDNSKRSSTSSDHTVVSGNSSRHITSSNHTVVRGDSTRSRTSSNHTVVMGDSTRNRISWDHSDVMGDSTRNRISSDHTDVMDDRTRHRTSSDYTVARGNSSRYRIALDHSVVRDDRTRHRTSSDYSDDTQDNMTSGYSTLCSNISSFAVSIGDDVHDTNVSTLVHSVRGAQQNDAQRDESPATSSKKKSLHSASTIIARGTRPFSDIDEMLQLQKELMDTVGENTFKVAFTYLGEENKTDLRSLVGDQFDKFC